MDQASSSWSTSASPQPAANGAGLDPAARDRHILLRIPDCTERHVVRIEQAARATGKTPLSSRLSWLTQGLARPWTRPRTMLAGAVGVLALLVAAALLVGKHHRAPSHAGKDRFYDDVEAPGWGAGGKFAAPGPAATRDETLDDAPAFPAGGLGSVRPNQPSSVNQSRELPRQAGKPTAAARSGAAPGPQEAHLEQRIDRVPARY